MRSRTAAVCAWCAPLAIILFGMALGPFARFTPPPSPAASADQIAAIYRSNPTGIIVGCALFLLSGTLLAPITALFSVFIRVMEQRPPLLAYVQLVTGTVALVLFIPPAIFWGVGAFRPERSPQLLLLLNDLGWASFIWVIWPGVLQVITIGTAILQDRDPNPLFPRWLGYLNLGGSLVFLLSSLALLAKTGPFAWDGALTHWIPVLFFSGWWIVMFVMSLRALNSPRLR